MHLTSTAAEHALEAAIRALNETDLTPERRKAAESVLLVFREQDIAWSAALSLLEHGHPAPELVLYAAQTIRFKVVEHASRLSPAQLEELRVLLLQQLCRQHVLGPVLRQLCLATAALAALLPSWVPVEAATTLQLPLNNGIELLTSVAEEGCGSWRHVVLPGDISLRIY